MSFDKIVPNIPPPLTSVLDIPKYNYFFQPLQQFAGFASTRGCTRKLFDERLSEHIEALNVFCKQEYASCGEELNNISRQMIHLLDQPLLVACENKKVLEGTLDATADRVVQLERFVTLCGLHLNKIVNYYDRQSGESLRMVEGFRDRLAKEPFNNLNYSGLVIVISDTYYTLSFGFGETDAWIPPDSFDRKTTKFWVRPEYVLAVKLAISKHVPILIYGKKQGLNKNNYLKEGGLKLNGVDSGSIVSVYFDNDNLDQYHARLYKEEGATLIRIRWYGKNQIPKSTCFVEQKTHHERWVDAKSVKERFPLEYQYMKGYLDGTFHFDELVPKISAKGDRKKTQLCQQWGLANEIQNNITSQNLKPVIRTIYNRTAFQLTTDNNVRLSLDTELEFVKEILPKKATKWVRFGKFPVENVLHFPLAVMEIKLNDGAPDWVMDLVASGYLIRAEYFSKFQHAAGIFFPEKTELLPRWFKSPNPYVNVSPVDSKHFRTRVETPSIVDIDKELRAKPTQRTFHKLLTGTAYAIEVDPILPEKKIDCSFYMANERIYLKWTGIVIFLSTSGFTLIQKSFASFGYFALLFCLVISGYSAVTFWVRKNHFAAKQNFYDPIGLSCVILGMFFFLSVYGIVQAFPDSSDTTANLVNDGDVL